MVPKTTHTHPKEVYWKFPGGKESQKSAFLKESINQHWNVGRDVQVKTKQKKKTSVGWGVFSGTTQSQKLQSASQKSSFILKLSLPTRSLFNQKFIAGLRGKHSIEVGERATSIFHILVVQKLGQEQKLMAFGMVALATIHCLIALFIFLCG